MTHTRRAQTFAVFHVLAVILLAGMLAPLCGCDRTRPATRPHTFLVVGLSQDDPLWPVLQGGARAYAATVSNLTLNMLAPPKEDPAAQADLVRRNMNPRVRGVCLQATANEHTRELATSIARQGLAVVLIGQDMPETGRLAYVGLDDFEAGKTLAQALHAAVGQRTTYMLLYADQGSSIYGERLRGFTTGMSQLGRLRELHRFDCNSQIDTVRQILGEQGRKYPDLAMWASLGDWPGSIETPQLRDALGENTGIVMIGAMPTAWSSLQQGIICAAVVTDYGRWGYEACNMAEQAFRRALQPGESRLTAPRIITPDDLPRFRQTWYAWTEGRGLPGSTSTQPGT